MGVHVDQFVHFMKSGTRTGYQDLAQTQAFPEVVNDRDGVMHDVFQVVVSSPEVTSIRSSK